MPFDTADVPGGSASRTGCLACFSRPPPQQPLADSRFAAKHASKANPDGTSSVDGWSIPTAAATRAVSNELSSPLDVFEAPLSSSTAAALAGDAGEVTAKQPTAASKQRRPSPARHNNDSAVITARLRSLEDIQLVEVEEAAPSCKLAVSAETPPQLSTQRSPTSPVPRLNLKATGRSPSPDQRSSSTAGPLPASGIQSCVSSPEKPVELTTSSSGSPMRHASIPAAQLLKQRSRSVSPNPTRTLSAAASVISTLPRSRSISPIHAEINAATVARGPNPVWATSTAESRAAPPSNPVRGTRKHPYKSAVSRPTSPEKELCDAMQSLDGRPASSDMLARLAATDRLLPADLGQLLPFAPHTASVPPPAHPNGKSVHKQPSVGNLLATLQHLNVNQRLREPLEHVSTAVQAAKSWQDKVASLQEHPEERDKLGSKLGSREDVRWEVWRLRAANEQLQKHASELAIKLAAQSCGASPDKDNKLKAQASLHTTRSLSPQRTSTSSQSYLRASPLPGQGLGLSPSGITGTASALKTEPSMELSGLHTHENEELKAWIKELQATNSRMEHERTQAQEKIEDLSRELLRAQQQMSDLRLARPLLPGPDRSAQNPCLPHQTSFPWLPRKSQAVEPLPAEARTWIAGKSTRQARIRHVQPVPHGTPLGASMTYHISAAADLGCKPASSKPASRGTLTTLVSKVPDV